MAISNGKAACAVRDDLIDRANTITKKAAQLHALLVALQPADMEEFDAFTRVNGLWLATDLVLDIFKASSGMSLADFNKACLGGGNALVGGAHV